MTIDASAFDFAALKEAVGGADPFASPTKAYARDERFYTLKKDKDGNGAALIRFMIDSEKSMIQTMYKVSTTIIKNGKKRFVNEFSPSTIGAPCPFQEKWQELWNAGKKDDVVDANGQVIEYGSKTFGRSTRYVTNILVQKDPANPENEGKVFLYEMSGAMKTKIEQAVSPSEQDRALGAQPKELFNPIQGNSFRLVAKKGANGQINYDSSDVVPEVSAAFSTPEEALATIKDKCYKLSDLLKPEEFMEYAELQKKLDWVTFTDQQPVTTQPLQATVAVAAPQVAEVQPVAEPVSAPQVAQAQPVAEVSVAQEVLEPETVQQPVQQPVQAEAPKQDSTSLDDLLAGL